MLKLWCAGQLGNCPHDLTRFRFTCLYCRWRRQYYGKWNKPAYWIKYIYKSHDSIMTTIRVTYNNRIFKLVKIDEQYLKIDPRGHFTMLRCAGIKVLDRIMQWVGYRKPFAEFCEFLAVYPTW